LPSFLRPPISIDLRVVLFSAFFFWVTERQQIRVSDALIAVAHSALYVADTDFGISYHALAVSSVRLVHPDVQHLILPQLFVFLLYEI
jgi:hypothetical protein